MGVRQDAADRRAGQNGVGLSIVAAVPTAVTGALQLDPRVEGEERRVFQKHESHVWAGVVRVERRRVGRRAPACTRSPRGRRGGGGRHTLSASSGPGGPLPAAGGPDLSPSSDGSAAAAGASPISGILLMVPGSRRLYQRRSRRTGRADPDQCPAVEDGSATGRIGTAEAVLGDREDREPRSADALCRLPIVGIGASAGGLEALKAFLGASGAASGVCYVVVQHLDPNHDSMLTELLGRCTDMAVLQAEDGMAAAPDRVIIIPPNTTLRIAEGGFRLERPAPPRTHRTPIDSFFQSLAADQGDGAVAIVLSGTGSDGTQGIRDVKGAGGFILVQDPATAKYDSMPRNAIATGLVDQVLAAEEMPGRVAEYLAHLRDEQGDDGKQAQKRDLRDELARICGLLKTATGHEFRHYREPTLIRRIQRRMQVLRLTDTDDYVARLRADKAEMRNLFRDLLVSVTGFFRDRVAFDLLRRRVIDPMVENRDDGDPIRVWVPGCATGEEAYTVAMLLHEAVQRHQKTVRIQVFATDIDESALEIARRGVYPESVAANVPDGLLSRHFRVRDSDYQVVEAIRELCLFSTQSLIKDPPFSRLDLISCRNVLIYLKTETQDGLIPVFHYALRPDGHLLLGPSETVSRHQNLFETVDKKWRLFRRREATDRSPVTFPLADLTESGRSAPAGEARRNAAGQRRDEIVSRAERTLLDDLGPAYAVVNEQRELVYSGGRIAPFLSLQPGAPSFEIVTIADQSLRMDIRALLHRAAVDQTETRREAVRMETANGTFKVTLICRPLGEDRNGTRHYLVVFDDFAPVPETSAPPDADGDGARLQAMESELRATKEYLQTTTEELESANEELKSANEELMSMNEELQSSNEELETSKEELQSVNEELETVNAELSTKVEELGAANNDLQNLLESTQIATLFLDRQLRVRRFTPVATEIFHLIESDVGRPIGDITTRLAGVDLPSEMRQVIDKLTPIEREVGLREGPGRYLMRLMPYRSSSDVIGGVVATFVDVGRQKEAQQEIDALNGRLAGKVEELETLLELAPVGIAFADNADCVPIEVNRFGSQIMDIPRQTPPAGDPRATYRFIREGREIAARDLPLQQAWRTKTQVRDFRGTVIKQDGQSFEMLMSAAPILDGSGDVRRVIGIFDDVSELVSAQRIAEARAAQHDFVATLGNRSLTGETAERMAEQLPRRLAQILNVDLAKILRFRATTGDFELTSAHGFEAPAGSVVAGDLKSQAGYTVHAKGPVVVENYARERRFETPDLLTRAGAVSGISVLVGDPEQPWGVIGAHSRTTRLFTADDSKFMQSIANVLAACLERDGAARRQELLLDELRHRVKNILATVQAVASLTFGGAAGNPAVATFAARLQALSQAHDLQFENDWSEVDLKELVHRQISPYLSGEESFRIDADGPVLLPAPMAIDISMVLHELATNAAKHGALSTGDGCVAISWRRQDSGVVRLDWKESGGPPVGEPKAEGVGGKLIRALSERPEFDVARTFEGDGMRCTLDIRLP